MGKQSSGSVRRELTGAPNDIIIIATVRSSTGQLEYSFRSKLQGLQYYFFENFEIFCYSFRITISYRKILIPLIWRNPSRVGGSPSQPRKKKLPPTSLRACSNCLALAMRPIRIAFDPVGRTKMSPSILQSYFPQDR